MQRNHLIQVASTLGMLVCLVAAAWLGEPINAQRRELQLTYNPTTHEAIPPSVALTQAALGSFRGLAVDFLWYRANEMKQAGQYREANQLSRMICLLQPRFAKVWVFHAWNMAYNISVATHTPEERWQWVNKGIRLLRDEGLQANPNSVLIKKELGWIFFHKIGAMSDDMHWYYRRKLAAEWQILLGSPEGLTTEQAIARMQLVADASDEVEEILTDESTSALVAHVKSLGYALDQRLLTEIGKILLFDVGVDNVFVGLGAQQYKQLVDVRLHLARRNPDLVPGFSNLLAYLRKKVLIEDYHMDPQDMVRMMQDYGPFDWRHPVSHAAYWSVQGIESAIDRRQKIGIDQLNTDRLIIHSMQTLTGSGRLAYDPVSGYLDMLPDPRFIDSYGKAMGFAKKRVDSGDFGKGAKASYESGHENFLQRAMMISYLYGDAQKAASYFIEWRNKYKNNRHNMDRIHLTMEELVLKEMYDNGGIFDNKRQFIDAMLRRALLDGLAKGRRDVYLKFEGIARLAHEKYQKTRTVTAIATQDRMRMPPFDELKRLTLRNMMKDARAPLILRGRIWLRSSIPERRSIYDQVRLAVQEQARQAGLDPERVLPEPENMQQYRQSQEPDGSPAIFGEPQAPRTIERQ